MVVVVSRFRASPGLESGVAAAFGTRPGLVDDAPGCLGFELFRDRDDPAVICLLTRWADFQSYSAWQSREPSRATVGRRVCVVPDGGEAGPRSVREALAELHEPVARLIEGGDLLVALADGYGAIRWCSDGFAALVGRQASALRGARLAGVLAPGEADRLLALALDASTPRHTAVALTLGAEAGARATLQCQVHFRSDGIAILAPAPSA